MYKQNLSENKELRVPYNLQFFAESGESEGQGNEGDGGADGGEEQENGGEDSPSVEELLAQLASERAERAKTKLALDNALSENKKVKSQLKTKMTAEEQLDEAKKEEEAKKDARIKELEEKMAVIDNTAFWGGKEIGMDEKTARATAEAEALGDKESFRANIAKHIKAIKDTALQEALKSREEVKGGHGSGDTDSMAIAMAESYASRKNGVNMDILNQY